MNDVIGRRTPICFVHTQSKKEEEEERKGDRSVLLQVTIENKLLARLYINDIAGWVGGRPGRQYFFFFPIHLLL